MDIGVGIFPTAETIRPDRLAVAAEERGFTSVWFPEHTHIPVDHSPYPAGGELPDFYARTFDLFVALTMAAAATTRITVASGVCLLAQRDPITTAKAVASLDVLSRGRVRFGVGYGWNRPEAATHGTAFAQRRAVVHDRLKAMKALWADDPAAYDGPHAHVPPSHFWPKPVQDPHPAVVLGAGAGPRTYERLIADCDGWMPIPGRGGSLTDVVPRLWQACEDAGRDPDTMPVWAAGAKPDEATLERYAGLGLRGLFYWLPQGPEAEVLDRLDELATWTAGYRR
jgi:probable F420-dependent oxidoreductase